MEMFHDSENGFPVQVGQVRSCTIGSVTVGRRLGRLVGAASTRGIDKSGEIRMDFFVT